MQWETEKQTVITMHFLPCLFLKDFFFVWVAGFSCVLASQCSKSIETVRCNAIWYDITLKTIDTKQQKLYYTMFLMRRLINTGEPLVLTINLIFTKKDNSIEGVRNSQVMMLWGTIILCLKVSKLSHQINQFVTMTISFYNF